MEATEIPSNLQERVLLHLGYSILIQYPCKPGTYNNLEGCKKEAECLKIPACYWNDGFAVIDNTKSL
jgi:hypothetical protein